METYTDTDRVIFGSGLGGQALESHQVNSSMKKKNTTQLSKHKSTPSYSGYVASSDRIRGRLLLQLRSTHGKGP